MILYYIIVYYSILFHTSGAAIAPHNAHLYKIDDIKEMLITIQDSKNDWRFSIYRMITKWCEGPVENSS